MDTLLLINAVAVLFLCGLAWFVHVVHYPLFAEIPAERWARYHELHSNLTTRVVLGPMAADLATSIALTFDAPGGETALAVAGAVLAVATWALTGLGAVPAHRALGDGFTGERHRRLMRADLVRALCWTAHGGVVIGLLIAA